MEVFRQAAETYTRELLGRIALDYSLPLDDLLAYADLTPTVQAPKTPNPFDKPLCQATTSTGTRCRFYARQDGLCGKHALPVDAETPRTCQVVQTVGTCSGTTAKGAPCKFAAKTEGLCGTHLRTSRPPTPPEAPKPTSPSPRAVSPVPTRSRSPTPPPLPKPKPSTVVRKAPSPAPPVKPKATTQPSVLEEDPEDEVSDSPGLQERLRAILKEASESDDDPDDDLNLDSLRAALDTVAVSELLSDDEDDEDASTDGEDDD